jgi:hypothetical protein
MRDHRLRAGLGPTPEGPSTPPQVRKYFLPFFRLRTGEFRAAFESHHPELRGFVPPGSDLKVFRPDALEAGAVVIEPSTPPANEPGEVLVHYPFARVALEVWGREQVFWVDASRCRLVVPGPGEERAGEGPDARVGRVMLGAFGVYFAGGLLLPAPWSIAAALLATPLLLRWAAREIGSAR